MSRKSLILRRTFAALVLCAAAAGVGGAQNVRYESCWSSVSSGGPKVEGRRLALALEDFRDDVRREVAYDADSPEQGLKVTQTAIPKSNP